MARMNRPAARAEPVVAPAHRATGRPDHRAPPARWSRRRAKRRAMTGTAAGVLPRRRAARTAAGRPCREHDGL